METLGDSGELCWQIHSDKMSRQIRTNSKYELVQTTVSLPSPVVHLLCDQSLCPLFLLCDCHSHFAFIMNFPDHCVHANVVPQQQKMSKGASRQNNLSFCMTMLNLPKRFQLLCLIAPLVLTAHDRYLPQFDFSFIISYSTITSFPFLQRFTHPEQSAQWSCVRKTCITVLGF